MNEILGESPFVGRTLHVLRTRARTDRARVPHLVLSFLCCCQLCLNFVSVFVVQIRFFTFAHESCGGSCSSVVLSLRKVSNTITSFLIEEPERDVEESLKADKWLCSALNRIIVLPEFREQGSLPLGDTVDDLVVDSTTVSHHGSHHFMEVLQRTQACHCYHNEFSSLRSSDSVSVPLQHGRVSEVLYTCLAPLHSQFHDHIGDVPASSSHQSPSVFFTQRTVYQTGIHLPFTICVFGAVFIVESGFFSMFTKWLSFTSKKWICTTGYSSWNTVPLCPVTFISRMHCLPRAILFRVRHDRRQLGAVFKFWAR